MNVQEKLQTIQKHVDVTQTQLAEMLGLLLLYFSNPRDMLSVTCLDYWV